MQFASHAFWNAGRKLRIRIRGPSNICDSSWTLSHVFVPAMWLVISSSWCLDLSVKRYKRWMRAILKYALTVKDSRKWRWLLRKGYLTISCRCDSWDRRIWGIACQCLYREWRKNSNYLPASRVRTYFSDRELYNGLKCCLQVMGLSILRNLARGAPTKLQ